MEIALLSLNHDEVTGLFIDMQEIQSSALSFNSKDELTLLVQEKGISSWDQLLEFTKKIPYGRNLWEIREQCIKAMHQKIRRIHKVSIFT